MISASSLVACADACADRRRSNVAKPHAEQQGRERMHKSFDVELSTGGQLVSENLRRHGATCGGIAAGLVLVGLATYAVGATTGSLSDVPLGPSSCQSSPILLVLGQDTDATMTVSGRTPCQISVRRNTASIEELTVSAFPRRGTLAERGRTGAIYHPDANFRGDDFFEFAMRGKSPHSSGASAVRVRVTIK